MNVDYIDFKTVSLTSKLDTSIGTELQLTQTGKVSVKLPEEWSGFAFLYLNIVIHDPEDKYFVFDITTETVIKLPDDVKEFSEEAMNARHGDSAAARPLRLSAAFPSQWA